MHQLSNFKKYIAERRIAPCTSLFWSEPTSLSSLPWAGEKVEVQNFPTFWKWAWQIFLIIFKNFQNFAFERNTLLVFDTKIFLRLQSVYWSIDQLSTLSLAWVNYALLLKQPSYFQLLVCILLIIFIWKWFLSLQHNYTYQTLQNSGQKVIDGVSYLSDAVLNVSSEPSKYVGLWVADKLAPTYWVPNSEITVRRNKITRH